MFQEISLSINKVVIRYARLNPWSNVYGLARSLIASSLLLTILFSDYDILIGKVVKGPEANFLVSKFQYNIFEIFSNNLYLGKYIITGILLLVIIGLLPQITSILHWWVCYSFMLISPVIEGGDQLNSIVTLLLIPVCLTDNRITHWGKPKKSNRPKLKLLCWSCYLVISLQVSIVYLMSCTSKFVVPEWVNGTAVYYWATHSIFGVNEALKPFVITLLSNKLVVIALTWGALFLELIFFSWIFMKKNKWNWKLLLFLSISFHFGIVILHGLVSFFLSIVGALIIYFIPQYRHIKINLKFLPQKNA